MRFPFGRARIEKLPEYLRQKDYPKALEAIEGALEKDPEDMVLRERRASVLGLSSDPRQGSEAYRQLGMAWVNKGFHAKAIAAYRKAVVLQDDRQDLHQELAELIGGPESDTASEASTQLDPGSILFSLFETRALGELLGETDLREFEAGDIIVTEGEKGASLFVLVEGEVKVYTLGREGEHLPLTELSAGDLFGEVAVLSGAPRTATVTASERVTAVEIDKTVIDRVSASHPKVREVLEQFCMHRAEDTIEALIRRRGET